MEVLELSNILTYNPIAALLAPQYNRFLPEKLILI
jgi:hypothetical protein